MLSLPDSIQRLASELGRLPGIGPRSAERLALYLSQADREIPEGLVQKLGEVMKSVSTCKECGALCDGDSCALCGDPRRDPSILCVVEKAVDIYGLEKTGGFKGGFHVLGGKLSPLDGVEPEDLRIAELQKRAGKGVSEVILALGSDVEGDATCHYVAQLLKGQGIKVTRLAHGLPAGSGLEFADEMTLSRALEGRREVD